MSYDYQALVTAIGTARRAAAAASTTEDRMLYLQTSVENFESLSSHCPMTPLLWMQYAADTATLLQALNTQDDDDEEESNSLQARLQLLTLGLAEFPGSAILHLHRLELLLVLGQKEDESSSTSSSDTFRRALSQAKAYVGQGSHRNEAWAVARIYRMDANAKPSLEQALETWLQRARIPLQDANANLTDEVTQFCNDRYQQAVPVDFFPKLEKARRFEAKHYSALVTHEDDVDVAMHTEGILARHQVAGLDDETIDWDRILASDFTKTCWMGLGGMGSAQTFMQYAKACSRLRSLGRDQDEDGDNNNGESREDKCNTEFHMNLPKNQELAIHVYERGVAECPTVESIWLGYLRHLEYWVDKDADNLLSRVQTVMDRAVRNCPYSLPLIQRKLELFGILASKGKSILDPDELMKTVQTVVAQKFIVSPESLLELYMTVVRVVRRRLLVLLSPPNDGEEVSFDGTEEVRASFSSQPLKDLSEEANQEVEDLCDDLREMYDAIDNYLRKNHKTWTVGRARLWSDRTYTETYLLGPLSDSFSDEDTSSQGEASTKRLAELIRCYDKLTKVCQPAHPDSFAYYIRGFLGTSFSAANPCHVVSTLRQTRLIFQKALKCVGKPKFLTPPLDSTIERDYETALRSLCHEYLVFERYFGSDKSLADATEAMQKKIAKTASSIDPATTNGGVHRDDIDKRKRETGSESAASETPRKKQKVDEAAPRDTVATQGDSFEAKTTTTETMEIDSNNTEQAKSETQKIHKIKIGNLEYPSHPFTVRVFGLVQEAEDMDLVELFRQHNCGSIVHARIMREKYHKPGAPANKSKGWGLVQFEERESVEAALKLSGLIGIKRKLVKIDRSHMPAVPSIVPTRMQHSNTKGGGKAPKRQERQPRTSPDAYAVDEAKPQTKDSTATAEVKLPTPGKTTLEFKPRIVRQPQKGMRKPKIALGGDLSR